MKISAGFISNSSSSSFILVGVELTGEEYEKNEGYIEENNLDVVYGDEGYLVGSKIASAIEEDGNDSWDLSLVESLKVKLASISSSSIKIYYGNEAC